MAPTLTNLSWDLRAPNPPRREHDGGGAGREPDHLPPPTPIGGGLVGGLVGTMGGGDLLGPGPGSPPCRSGSCRLLPHSHSPHPLPPLRSGDDRSVRRCGGRCGGAPPGPRGRRGPRAPDPAQGKASLGPNPPLSHQAIHAAAGRRIQVYQRPASHMVLVAFWGAGAEC